jgi:uncharacterized damage-inducible protein DinB
MSLAFQLEELLAYTDHERLKWRDWIAEDPRRLDIPFQQNGRFPTVGSVLDHVFLVERRHLSRLQGATPPDSTGVPHGDWQALFEYAQLVRADLRKFVADLDQQSGTTPLTFGVQTGTYTMTRRKLSLHIVLHEIRHLAQVALAVREAGREPPGTHDLFYFTELA